MVIDIGVVRNYIKPKADSTLANMRKVALIEYIRTLEHNYNVAVSFNENQAKYIESLGFKDAVRCKDCECFPDKCLWTRSLGANGFCSQGKRRAPDENI